MTTDFAAVGQILSGLLGARAGAGADSARLLAEAWPRVLGPEAAANAQPRSLRAERLVVATSSAAWAQILQEREIEVLARLARELGEGVVRAVVFRPAGWDPCAAPDAPRALEADPGAWDQSPDGPSAGAASPVGTPRRELTEEELAAVRRVREAAPDDLLGERMAAAMRAGLERTPSEESR